MGYEETRRAKDNYEEARLACSKARREYWRALGVETRDYLCSLKEVVKEALKHLFRL